MTHNVFDYYFEICPNKKQPTEKWDEMTTYNDEPKLDNFGARVKDDVCFVDIDDPEQGEVLLKIVNDLNLNTSIVKTTKGYHFYFKKPTDINRNRKTYTCLIGLDVELKLGSSKAFEPLMVKGRKRPILKESDTLDFLPVIFSKMKRKIDFYNMGEGDSRNDNFRDYQFQLAGQGIKYDLGKRIGEIINTYVLAKPLPKREFDTVFREEIYPEVIPDFFNEGKFKHATFGDWMIQKYKLCNIDGVLHHYEDGLYVSDIKQVERFILQAISILKNNQRQEVLKYVSVLAPDRELTGADYICFKNGVYNIKEDHLYPHNENFTFKNMLTVDYNPAAQSSVVDTMFDNISVNDPEVKTLIYEMVGYTMYRRNELGKSFILVGKGSNGKSTLLDMIKNMLGETNVTALDLKQLQEKFMVGQVHGKLANIGDDISANYIKDSSEFKKLVTGDMMTVDVKNGASFTFKNYSKFIFSANKLPKSGDKSHGFYRRFCPVPLTADFSKRRSDFDFEIADKLNQNIALEYLAILGIKYFKEVLKRKSFTEPSRVSLMLDDYKLINSNVLTFLDINKDVIEERTLSHFYDEYKVWCHQDGHKHCSKTEFKAELAEEGFVPSKSTVRRNGKGGKFFIPMSGDDKLV